MTARPQVLTLTTGHATAALAVAWDSFRTTYKARQSPTGTTIHLSYASFYALCTLTSALLDVCGSDHLATVRVGAFSPTE